MPAILIAVEPPITSGPRLHATPMKPAEDMEVSKIGASKKE